MNTIVSFEVYCCQCIIVCLLTIVFQAFSINLRYLVSVGYQHDQNVFVWNWKANAKLATNKITTKVSYRILCSHYDVIMISCCDAQVSGISFSEDGKYFVTVGNRRVRYWYFDTTTKDSKVKCRIELSN